MASSAGGINTKKKALQHSIDKKTVPEMRVNRGDGHHLEEHEDHLMMVMSYGFCRERAELLESVSWRSAIFCIQIAFKIQKSNAIFIVIDTRKNSNSKREWKLYSEEQKKFTIAFHF